MRTLLLNWWIWTFTWCWGIWCRITFIAVCWFYCLIDEFEFSLDAEEFDAGLPLLQYVDLVDVWLGFILSYFFFNSGSLVTAPNSCVFVYKFLYNIDDFFEWIYFVFYIRLPNEFKLMSIWTSVYMVGIGIECFIGTKFLFRIFLPFSFTSLVYLSCFHYKYRRFWCGQAIYHLICLDFIIFLET